MFNKKKILDTKLWKPRWEWNQFRMHHFSNKNFFCLRMNSDEDEDESEFIQSMSKVKEEEIICLDVGGERHYVRRGLLIRLIHF